MGAGPAVPERRPNVLFIVADDLRTDLACYGEEEAITPHLDRLARHGVRFDRAYCQQAVCNPSRASVLTGQRPDTLRVWDLRVHFRDLHPSLVTLPQHFRNHGYRTIGLGKVFHNQTGRREGAPFSDPMSWSEAPLFADGAHWQDWVVPGSAAGPARKGGATQRLDVPDEAYLDGRIAAAAVARLQAFRDRPEPFFLAVGFWKPHLPFNAPKRYWDLYDRSRIATSAGAALPAGAPALAGHGSEELRSYVGVPRDGPIPPDLAAELRHGYLAAVSFLDAQVGKVLEALRALDLERSTIVVFWSDHGFHLGEHAFWGKSTNYERDTRVPLIISAPGLPSGRSTGALVELVDLYPTLTDLCGLPAPPDLAGVSLRPLLSDPSARGKDFAVSQHPRPYFNGELSVMGYTLRSERHRYVEWRRMESGEIVARELYEGPAAAGEVRNRIDDPELATVRRDFEAAAARLAPPPPGQARPGLRPAPPSPEIPVPTTPSDHASPLPRPHPRTLPAARARPVRSR